MSDSRMSSGQRSTGSATLWLHQSSTAALRKLCKPKEVCEQYVPLWGEYRLRMELHAICWLIAMGEGHEFPIIRECCHREVTGR